MQDCTTGIKTLANLNPCSSDSMRWNTLFQMRLNTPPPIPKSTPWHKTTTPQNEECSSLLQSNTPHLSDLSVSPPHQTLTIVNFTYFGATKHFYFIDCVYVCMTWWWSTMMHFYPLSLWHHCIHKAVKTSLDRVMVLATMTPHNRAVSTTELIAHHFLWQISPCTCQCAINVHNNQLVDSSS